MSDLLFELLNSTLVKRPLNEEVFRGASETDWLKCFDMALEQNVLAMTFPAMTSLPKELRPSFTLWSKWMAYAQNITKQSEYKREVVKKIGSWLAEDGLTTTLIKGFSLSALYPTPSLREFSDIDIFSGVFYEAVNTCFAKHGVPVDSVDGHHAYMKVNGVSVEHHFAFHNTKVKRGLEGPEKELQQLAVKDLQPASIKGICFPCLAFTALFVGWHAYEHFLQEKIHLRHVIDWAVALKHLSESDTKILSEAKTNAHWRRFTDTLTAIALHRLGLPHDWFPAKEQAALEAIASEQEQRVWNDIIQAPPTPHSCSNNIRRVSIAKRMLKNNWKYKTYSNMSASQLVLKEAVGHFKTLRVKTDSKL